MSTPIGSSPFDTADLTNLQDLYKQFITKVTQDVENRIPLPTHSPPPLTFLNAFVCTVNSFIL